MTRMLSDFARALLACWAVVLATVALAYCIVGCAPKVDAPCELDSSSSTGDPSRLPWPPLDTSSSSSSSSASDTSSESVTPATSSEGDSSSSSAADSSSSSDDSSSSGELEECNDVAWVGRDQQPHTCCCGGGPPEMACEVGTPGCEGGAP